MVKRYLITTALEETWPTPDKPVIFLGEWCKLYDRRQAWEKYDSITVPYHWDDRQRLYKDYLYLRDLYERILPSLGAQLNAIHKADHSLRYWRIVIGPWLGFFIQILFDRYQMIVSSQKYHAHLVALVPAMVPVEMTTPNDMTEFDRLYKNDSWNNQIYHYLIRELNIPGELSNWTASAPESAGERKTDGAKRRTKEFIAFLAEVCFGLFSAGSEAFIFKSYLPRFEAFCLQAKLGQVPRLWKETSPPFTNEINVGCRGWSCGHSGQNEFENILNKLIPLQMPMVYLEGYTKSLEKIAVLKWPKSPRFIFTSNSHSSDDIFKIWAAEKVQSGTPLYIGQHGGHYGVGLWSFMEEHEIAIADKYISWGWQEKMQKKVTPAFALNLCNKKDAKWDENGALAIVLMALPRFSYWMYSVPIASQYEDYFSQQPTFYHALDGVVQKKTIFRSFPIDFGWNLNKRLLALDHNLNIDQATGSIEALYKKSRLLVSTYNATNFLESLGRNMPTIMFWNPKHWELRSTAIPFFMKLKLAGIFHETPDSAAEKVNEIWNNVHEWWSSSKVQSARLEFCEQYAKTMKNPLNHLRNILKN